MGLTTWIMIAILILSIIGLGWQTFVLGVFKGGEKIINSNPEIKNATNAMIESRMLPVSSWMIPKLNTPITMATFSVTS